MTVTTAVQDAVVRLGQDLAQRGWDLGCGLWAIHPHADASVTLEKRGGAGFHAIPVFDLIEQLPPPVAEHCGFVLSFDVYISDSGMAPIASDAPDRVDARIILAALTSGVVIVFEHRADRLKARVTLDDGKAPPISPLAAVAAHLRQKVCAPRPRMLDEFLRHIGADAIIVIDPTKGEDPRHE